MGFNIGDKVIHWTYGLGEIVHIEEKFIRNEATNCYVVRTNDLMIWIPINEVDQQSLRIPTPSNELVKLFDILTKPPEPLPQDRVLRKEQLMTQLKDGQLASICRVVRDLTHYKRQAKLNEQEKALLERATNSLLSEWIFSLDVPLNQAHQSMMQLLGE